MNASEIIQNVARCDALLKDASAQWGEAELCAVSKTIDAQIVNMVWEAGVRRLGENRVQEVLQKFPALNPGFSVDLIGQLQTNKVKYIMDCIARVQSLDRVPLADELNKRAQQHGRVMPCLVQVNIAKEPQKAGIEEEALERFIRYCAHLPGIHVEGLMAVMPLVSDPETIRPYFRQMRVWFDRLKNESIEGVDMRCLSMGMSGDFIVAAQEGATLVRVGSAIFGKRNYDV